MHYVRIASYTSSILYETPSPRFVWWLITCCCMARAYDSCTSVSCAGAFVVTVCLTMAEGKSKAVAVTKGPPPEVGSRCKLLGGLFASLLSCYIINTDMVFGAFADVHLEHE